MKVEAQCECKVRTAADCCCCCCCWLVKSQDGHHQPQPLSPPKQPGSAQCSSCIGSGTQACNALRCWRLPMLPSGPPAPAAPALGRCRHQTPADRERQAGSRQAAALCSRDSHGSSCTGVDASRKTLLSSGVWTSQPSAARSMGRQLCAAAMDPRCHAGQQGLHFLGSNKRQEDREKRPGAPRRRTRPVTPATSCS